MYDVSGGAGDRNCVVLNDIHIDIMDYIVPASCTDSEFRQMWAEFEWENKVKWIYYWTKLLHSTDEPCGKPVPPAVPVVLMRLYLFSSLSKLKDQFL